MELALLTFWNLEIERAVGRDEIEHFNMIIDNQSQKSKTKKMKDR